MKSRVLRAIVTAEVIVVVDPENEKQARDLAVFDGATAVRNALIGDAENYVFDLRPGVVTTTDLEELTP